MYKNLHQIDGGQHSRTKPLTCMHKHQVWDEPEYSSVHFRRVYMINDLQLKYGIGRYHLFIQCSL